MYKSKKQILENIEDYVNHKKICELTKPKSFKSIIIVEDKDDPWFLYILTYKNKSGEITSSNMIIKSDYDSWLEFLEDLGWKIKI